MKTHTKFVLGTCFAIAISAPGLWGQARQRQAPGTAAPVRPPLTRDQREDVRDRREDVRDRREDVRDRREDIRDAQRDGGIGDRREDVRDRREDVRDRREDVRDRLENRIDRNPRFAARMRQILPQGTSPRDAISGFKNEGQFYATLHASKNLDIPFDQLKAKLTGDQKVSLGEAIHTLRPELSESDIRNAVRKRRKTLWTPNATSAPIRTFEFDGVHAWGEESQAIPLPKIDVAQAPNLPSQLSF